MTSKMGQSVMDRVTAAKHTIAGQGLAKTVCKATTEEVMGPKRKHLDYLLQCTNEPNVSIPQLADLLIERTQQSSWVIVFKALVTIHNLMNYGNERFTQYLASNNCTFNLGNFIDKTGVQGYDMSTFVRRYAKYLNEKAVTYRLMAFDFCKVKRGRDDGLLRTMNTEKLLKTLPVLQQQIDALLEFDCTANELTNGVINACFMLMFKDLIRLFACYNDGTINLLEKYFEMQKKQCKDALDIYKKFLVRMDKVSEFLKVAENVGIEKSDIPDLAKAPASLLDALEEHLKSLEGKKSSGVVVPPPSSKPSGYTTAIRAIAGNSTINVSEEEKKKILEEESKQLQQLKEQKAKDAASASPSQQAPVIANNLFISPVAAAQTQAKPSDDLLNLNDNPFVENVKSVMQMNAFVTPAWGQPTASNMDGFSDSHNFASFPNGVGSASISESVSFDPYESRIGLADIGVVVKDEVTDEALFETEMSSKDFDAFGQIMQPQNTQQKVTGSPAQQKLSPNDIESNLALLAGNISIKGNVDVKKGHQWQPRAEQKKTGGENWTPTQMAQATTWSQPVYQPSMSPVMGGYRQPMMQPMMHAGMVPMAGAPVMAGMPMTGMPMTGMPQMSMGQPMYGMVRPGMQPMMGQPRLPTSQPNDPFGAL